MSHDDKLIVALLIGRVENDEHGLPQSRFMKDGSDEENAARRALAKLLRNPSRRLDTGLRWALAELIEPNGGYDPSPRRIKFENRHRGTPATATTLREKIIAEFVWNEMQAGRSEKAAKSNAADKFKFSSDTRLKNSHISAIWKRWQPILERLKRVNLKGESVEPFAG